jgi:TadE-like protein
MRDLVSLRARGQALIETAIALPVFLIAMFGVIWSLQSGVLGERVQMAARYGGMVSAQGNPFQQYSLYGVYGAAAGAPIVAPCGLPPAQMLSNGSPLVAPAPASPKFWQPSGSPTVSGKCGRTLSTAAGLSGPKLLGHAQMTVDATNDVPLSLQAAFGGASTPWNATINELESPDMGTLVACYPELQAGFAASVNPPAGNGNAPSVAAIAQPLTSPLSLDASCSGG